MNFPINIQSFLTDTILLILIWGFMAAAFYAWGNFLSNIIGIKIQSIKKHTAKIWLGWVFGLFFFAFYHLFLPINAFASCLFYFSGIIYFFIRYGKRLLPFIKSLEHYKIIAILLILLASSVIAIQLPVNYDTGLYHLNSIRWANEHHIIKGIGNLHVRLGLNQLFFLYAASLNFHPYVNDYAFHAANSFLYAVFVVSLILSGTFIDLLLLCLFFYLPMPYYWIANPTPDMASTLLQITAFWFFIEVVYFKPDGNDKANLISLAAILTAILVTVKLSNVLFALGLGLITLIYCRKHPFDNLGKKVIGRAFAFIGIFVCLWVIRGYIQTGYPAFPSSVGSIKFNWTVPKRLANYMENCVYCGSRTNGQIVDPKHPIFKEKWAWLDAWVKWNFFDEKEYLSGDLKTDTVTWIMLLFFPMIMFNWGMGSVTLFILSISLLIVWIRALYRKKVLFEQTNYMFYLFLAAFASICFWFFVAPEVRFANGIFIVLFISALLLVRKSYSAIKVSNSIKRVLLVFPIIMYIWAFWLGYSVDAFRIDGMMKLNKAKMNTFVTNSGIKLLVPVISDQCWDSELPSTPEPEKGLALIGSSIDDGFCINETF